MDNDINQTVDRYSDENEYTDPARESFIFYRSFYQAIKHMPPSVQIELYPAIIEYALYGIEPEGVSDIALGMLELIKPNIDANASRFKNGAKGAEYGRLGGRPRKTQKKYTDQPVEEGKENDETPLVAHSFKEEAEIISADEEWRKSVCSKFNIADTDFQSLLDQFVDHCVINSKSKAHKDIADAKIHFCNLLHHHLIEPPKPSVKPEAHRKIKADADSDKKKTPDYKRFQRLIPQVKDGELLMSYTQYQLLGFDKKTDDYISKYCSDAMAGKIKIPSILSLLESP